MAWCVWVFSTECWTKCINVTNGTCIVLDTELSWYGKESWFTKEVFFVINLTLFKWNNFFSWLWLCFNNSFSLCTFNFLNLLLFFGWFLRFLFFVFLPNISVDWNLTNGFFRIRKCGCNLEHFTCTFTIWCCNAWSVNVKEATLLEESVGGVWQVVSNSCHCWDKLCART